MELRQLRALVCIAECGNLTRAAQQLGMQQPPLTRLLQQLEAEMGTPLMERLPRGMRPTAAGLALVQEARMVLARVEAMAGLVQDAAQGGRGHVAIGFTSSAALHPLVAQALRAFRAQWPRVKVTLEEAGSGELLDGLLAQRLHAALVRSAWEAQPSLSSRHLLSEPMVVAGPLGHALMQSRRPLPLAQLRGQPLVLYRRPAGPGLHDGIVAACVGAGFHPQVVQEAPRLTATLSLVAAGLGLSIVPASLQSLRSDGLAYRRLSGAPGLVAPLILVSQRRPEAQACVLLQHLGGILDQQLTLQRPRKGGA